MSNPEPLTLEMEFGLGEGIAHVPAAHPLVAPFRRSIETGKPAGAWRYLLYQNGERAPYIIGTFGLTPGNRLLFFPGGSAIIRTDDPSAEFNGHRLDHVTLDPADIDSAQASHVAVFAPNGKKSRGLNRRSRRPRGHLFPWLSMLLPDLDGFFRLPRVLRATFAPPRPDIQRFAEQILGNGGAAVVPAPELKGTGESYLQFDVWVGKGQEWETGKARVVAWPYKPEIVRNAPAPHQDLQVRRLHIGFGEDLGLVLLVSRPIGELQGGRLLRPTLNFDSLEVP